MEYSKARRESNKIGGSQRFGQACEEEGMLSNGCRVCVYRVCVYRVRIYRVRICCVGVYRVCGIITPHSISSHLKQFCTNRRLATVHFIDFFHTQ